MNWADYFRRKGILPRYGNFVGPEWSGGTSFPSVYDMIHVQPLDTIDAIAKEHDLRYFVATTVNDVRDADRMFTKRVDEAFTNGWFRSNKEKTIAHIAKAAMLVKLKVEDQAGSLYGKNDRVPISQRQRVIQYLNDMDAKGGIVKVFYESKQR